MDKIESVIQTNYGANEPVIVSKIVNEWNLNPIIKLQPFNISGNQHHLSLEFTQLYTHGKPYVSIEVEPDEKETIEQEYETEFGDLALIVEYYLESTLLSSRLSLLQTKKESKQNQVDIALNQLYLMHFWPTVKFVGQTFKFPNMIAEDFSFYHFILDKSQPSNCTSTICSTPLITTKLGVSEWSLVSQLKKWNSQRKITGTKLKAPTLPFEGVMPGAIEAANSWGNNWNSVPKPFSRFLHEAAYLFVGTPNKEVRQLAELRVPNILLLRARASREEGQWQQKER